MTIFYDPDTYYPAIRPPAAPDLRLCGSNLGIFNQEKKWRLSGRVALI